MNGDGTGVSNRVLLVASVIFIFVVGAILFLITQGGKTATPVSTKPQVTDTRLGRSVKMTVKGPIVGEEGYTSYSIEVSRDSRVITRMQGYQGTISDERTYDNNRRAYEEFVYALQRARFSSERTVAASGAEERGVCATGKRYEFELLQSGSQLQRLWTTSCQGSRGTLAGNATNLKSLFDKQIPELSQVLKGSRL